MSRNGLGKGLGDLLNGDRVAGSAPVAAPRTLDKQEFGRGLNTLVAAKPAELEQKKTRQLLPAWFFFAADLLLLGYTVAIAFDAPRPFDFGTVMFCAVSITLGCLLALAGVLRMRQ